MAPNTTCLEHKFEKNLNENDDRLTRTQATMQPRSNATHAMQWTCPNINAPKRTHKDPNKPAKPDAFVALPLLLAQHRCNNGRGDRCHGCAPTTPRRNGKVMFQSKRRDIRLFRCRRFWPNTAAMITNMAGPVGVPQKQRIDTKKLD